MKPDPKQLDALKEMINIGMGKGAKVLNTMLSSHIQLSVPFVKILSLEELTKEVRALGDELAGVDLSFRGNLGGTAQLIFSAEAASKLVTALTGKEPEIGDVDSIRSGTLCEIGNIVLNGVMGSISNLLGLHLTYSVPNFLEGSTGDFLSALPTGTDVSVLLARTRFKIEKLEIDGDIAVFFDFGGLDGLLAEIDKVQANLERD